MVFTCGESRRFPMEMCVMWKTIGAAVWVAIVGMMVFPNVARAEEIDCRTRVTRGNLVRCALAANLSVRAEEKTTEVVEGRRLAATPFFPSNPALALTGARRGASTTEPTTLNWSATLSQELEVAGQRGARLKAVDAELNAQAKRVLLSKREAAFIAWVTFFEVVGAREQRQLMERLLLTSQRMATVSRARAEKGVGSPIEADIADAATTRVLQAKLSADRSLTSAQATLDLILGRGADAQPPTVDGDLVPLPIPDAALTVARTFSDRPEAQVLEAERRANLARAEAFRRLRIPNPTLSIFAQNDGYNENVLGVGISFPIPLPTPVGRTYAGEIAESEALADRAEIERARVERELRAAVARTYAAYTSHRQLVESITPERLKRAEESLRDLGTEIETGRLAVREALLAQQQLIDLLVTNITERRELCLASVELSRALGLPLEGAAR